MIDVEHEVREALRRHELEVPVPDPADAPTIARRARTRQVLNGLGTVVIAGLVVLGVATGVGAILRADPTTPADEHATLDDTPPFDALVDLRTGEVEPVPDEIRAILDVHPEYRASPDGSTVAFVAAREDGVPQVHVADIDGSNARVVVDDGTSPAWSPDGSRIVYEGAGETIWVVDVGSGETTRVFDRAGRVWLPSFTPDGDSILFTRSSHQGRYLGLWTVPATGGTPTLLRRDAAFGAYSPDGRMIVFHAVSRAVDPDVIWPFDFGLTLTDADGRHAHRLVRASGCCTMAPFDWDWTRPVWSPDGTRIAFQWFGMMPEGIWVVDVATRAVTELGTGALPSWVDDRTLIIENYFPERRGR